MIKVPSVKTLDKYGLTLSAWAELLQSQEGMCGVCGKEPNSGRLNIDHEHVKRWASKPPEERVKYVRGLACFMCNRYFLAKGATVARLQSAAEYLCAYETRKAV